MNNEIKEIVYTLIEKLKPILPAKFVEKENLHLSVKFLGELREDELKNVKASRFSIKLHGLGYYPSPVCSLTPINAFVLSRVRLD